MRKKVLKIIAIGLSLVIVLSLLFVVAFIFNPFEGSLTDMRELVPRDVDYFVRKTELRDDFDAFPVPVFWSSVDESNTWRRLRGGPTVRGLERDAQVGRAISELRDIAARVANGSNGFADLLDDVIGTEVIVAGKFRPPTPENAAFCAYTRVSWKVRFVWGLLEWESVRSSLAEQGTTIELRDDGVMVVQSGPEPLFVARFLDCIMVCNDEDLLAESLLLAAGGGDDSFGRSSDYRDDVELRVRDWEEDTGRSANSVEFYLRPDQLLALTSWDDGWPDPRHPDDMNQRVLASFLNVRGWRFLSAAAIFEEGLSLSLLGRVGLNRNMHTAFQAEFFKAEAQPWREWLSPFLSMVPRRSAAAAALRMPAGDFLEEMYRAVDPKLRADIDEQISRTGVYDGVGQIIDKIRPALLPRTGFVFHRSRDVSSEGFTIETFEPSPAPHVAWVFWIDPRFRPAIEEFYTFLTDKAGSLGFENVFDLPVTLTEGGDAAREFVSPHIPATGEIAVLLYGNFLVLSNSGPLIGDMIHARQSGDNVTRQRDFQTYLDDLADRLNGFVFLQGPRISEIVDDYDAFLTTSSVDPDEGWLLSARPNIERQILRTQFSTYSTVAAIPQRDRQRFEDAVWTELQRGWQKVRENFLAEERTGYLELKALMDSFSSAGLQVTLNPQSLDLRASVFFEFR